MAELYRTEFAGAPSCDTIVIHCSDPRYQGHFQEFLRGGLGLANYGLVAVPGGPQFLTLVDYLPKFSWAGWRWVKFLADFTKARRAVLIAHDDCRWYVDGGFWQRRGNLRERQVRDLEEVRAQIAQRFPGIVVDLYYARLDGDHAVFEAL